MLPKATCNNIMEIDKPQAAMSRTEQSGCVWGGWVWRYCSFSQPCKSSPTHTSRQSQNGEKTANLSLSQIHELLDYSFEHTAKTICTGFTLTGRRRIS
jgi:hypothetical protein